MRLVVLALSILLAWPAKAADSIMMRLQPGEPAPVLEWHSQINLPLAGMAPEYIIEWSSDLSNWQQLGAPVPGGVGIGDEVMRRVVSGAPAKAFYRIRATVNAVSGNHADSIYGYATEFSRNLQAIGQIPLADFVQMFAPTNEFRAQISFDPTMALFWNDFNTDPAVYNATNTTNDKRLTDFRFTPEESAIFKTNGFVVSPRLGSYSFADAFYKVYIDDLPVYVSSDALLQAWHRTYVSVLAEVEGSFLAARFGLLLTNMISQIPTLHAEAAGTPLEQGVRDADYYLAVAKSLLTGTNDFGYLNQTEDIQKALDAVASVTPQWFVFFGRTPAQTDFSQYKPRGHYADSTYLQRYFRAMKWCALVDFRFGSSSDPQSLREFSTAATLTLALERSGFVDKWIAFDQTIRAFVGLPDCMNFVQLRDMLVAANFAPPYDKLAKIYDDFWKGDLGVQQIRSGYIYSPVGLQQLKLPRSFATMPQRFVIDSWALSKVVYDSIIWDFNGAPEKVQRRVPSALDVAFSVMDNDNAVEEIAARIANPNVGYRDGLPYQHNLAAVRQCVDAHEAGYWTNNMYTAWVGCLRALSSPTTGATFPEAMQTRAFAMSSLNTQMASWTQLRHNTVLYAKQSSTAMTMCGYPYGYVEPRPEFWRRFGAMAARTRDLLAALPDEGMKVTAEFEGRQFGYSTAQLKNNWFMYYQRFVAAAAKLQSIAEKEINHADLDASEIDFLKNVIEQHSAYVSSGGRTYSGWYPELFYKTLEHNLPFSLHEGSDLWDALVTDVHTDPRDEGSGDPGCILHEGVGNVNMAFIVVNCRNDERPIMYAGPVLSHFEFGTDPTTRLTDAQWKAMIKNGQQPPAPSWTKSFLAPGAYTIPPEVY